MNDQFTIERHPHCNINFDVAGAVARFLGQAAVEGVVGSLPWPGCEVLLAYEGTGEPIGVMLFQRSDYADTTLQISLGYVLPAFRRCGVYRRLFNELVGIAKELNARTIRGDTLMTNETAIAAFKRLGRKPAAMSFLYDVE